MLARGVAATDGEPALSEAQISDTFADTAAQFDNSTGNDQTGLSLRTLSSQPERDLSIKLLARLLAQPAFPDDLLAREKARIVAAIREAETKPAAIAGRAFMQAMYGTHPYAYKPTAASVETLTRDDLLAFHRTHYVANRAYIAIIGDTSRAGAEAIARQLTQRLPVAGVALPALPAVAAGSASERRIAHPASQAHILIGMPAVQRGDPDYFALMVGNYVLGGGGFVSRLMHEVREKRGLSYSVSSGFNPLKQAGPFKISLQTKKDQTEQALAVTRATLATFLRDGPTEAELKAAKDNLIGGFALRIDTNKKMLDNLAVIGFYGLPLDYLQTWKTNVAKVTAADVRAAFKRKLARARMTTVIVGGAE
jgi:zinc protease